MGSEQPHAMSDEREDDDGQAVKDPRQGDPTAYGQHVGAGPDADDRSKPVESESEQQAPVAETKDKESKETRRSRFETLLPGLIRRGIERGIEAGLNTFEKSLETGRETTDAVKEVFSEVRAPRDVASAVGRALTEAKLPRELASVVFTQIDETKNDLLRIVAKEFRDFLEATDLASELKAALTSLSFEIRTEVRFIPNEAGTGVKPDVRARTRVKRNPPTRERERRRGRRHRFRRAHDEEHELEEHEGDEHESDDAG